MLDGFLVEDGLVPWVIEFHEDVFVSHALLKGSWEKDFFVELDAPATPVGTGEVDEEVLVFFSGFGLAASKSCIQPSPPA